MDEYVSGLMPLSYAAERLGVSRGVLQRLVASGALVPKPCGKRLVLIDLAEAREALTETGRDPYEDEPGRRRNRSYIHQRLRRLVEEFSAQAQIGLLPKLEQDDLGHLVSALENTARPVLTLVSEAATAGKGADRDRQALIDQHSLVAAIPLRGGLTDSVTHQLWLLTEPGRARRLFFLKEPVDRALLTKSSGEFSVALGKILNDETPVVGIWGELPYEKLEELGSHRLDHAYIRVMASWPATSYQRHSSVVPTSDQHPRLHQAGLEPMGSPFDVVGGLSWGQYREVREANWGDRVQVVQAIEEWCGFQHGQAARLEPGTARLDSFQRCWLQPNDIAINPAHPMKSVLVQDLIDAGVVRERILLGPGLVRLRCAGLPCSPATFHRNVFRPESAPWIAIRDRYDGGRYPSYFSFYWNSLAVGSRGRRLAMADLQAMPVPPELLLD